MEKRIALTEKNMDLLQETNREIQLAEMQYRALVDKRNTLISVLVNQEGIDDQAEVKIDQEKGEIVFTFKENGVTE